jgi:FAD/FMN-containing dehydrogenase
MTDMLTTAAPIVTPADAAYDEARQAWNLAVDQRPAAVAEPGTVADVVAAVAYARSRGLRVAAQGTGHNASPLGDLSDTVLVKTHRMRGVEVDNEARIARVQAGAVWADVVHAAAPHGLTPLMGSSHDVGVVGYCLGGGLSFLSRRHGIAANRVLAIELVLADGRHVRADRRSHAELFWALRGGGGSFGVVTAIEIELLGVGPLHAGTLFFGIERASEVLHAWRELTQDLPDTVSTVGRVLRVPPLPHVPEPLRGRAFALVEFVILEPRDVAERYVAPIRALGPEMDTFGPATPVDLLALHMDPPGPVPGTGDHQLLDALPPEAIDAAVVAAASERGNALLSFEIRHLGGAIGRSLGGHGALDRIQAPYATFGVGIAATPEMRSATEVALAGVRAALAPYASDREYLNFAEHAGDSARLYGAATWQLLREVKRAVDPDDVIRANHPVPPAA